MNRYERVPGYRYDRDFGRQQRPQDFGARTWGYGAGVWGGASDFDRGYDQSYRGNERGYDRGMRNRWQTDNGDPFGDRAAHTPMRIMREGYDRGYDQSYRSGQRGYDRDFGNREFNDRDRHRGAYRNNRYDSGWF